MNQNYRFMELSQFGTPLHWAAHGVVGGASAEAQGGKFGQQGFISLAFTKAVSTQGLLPGSKQGGLSIESLAGHAVVGGTASELSGGKFANGAQTAAYGYLFNEVSMDPKEWFNPTGGGLRECGPKGCGHYGASRPHHPRGLHEGADYIAKPGQNVVAAKGGRISKYGYAYAGDSEYRIIDITSGNYRVRHFYVRMLDSLSAGDVVSAGDIIGYYQGIGNRYPGITEHVHMEIIYEGKKQNPANYIPVP